ncbi:MAG TPA: Gfo/Idh/MocA family oxidoreductase [Marmoricola sp.]|nr:Gfo/Idh/MocA family oxidoreductase [Marmoricola sp.]
MPQTTRIALVGVGSMGRNHARVIAAHPDTELAVVIDPGEEAGRAAAESYGARYASDLDGLDDVGGVVVAAPTEHHHELALAVIGAGLPLLIEKPVCASLAQTEQVLEASRRAGTPLMCGLLERFNPAVVAARRMVEAPLLVRAERHSPYAPRIKTGVAWDLLVHDVDLVVQMFGGNHPRDITVEVGHFHPASAPGAEDVIECALGFENGGLATVSASRIGQRKVRTMMIQELDRTIEIDLLRRTLTAYRHTTIEASSDDGLGFRQATEMEVPEIVGAEPLVSQLSHFVGLIHGERDAEAERTSILPAHDIVDRALRGSRGHNTV